MPRQQLPPFDTEGQAAIWLGSHGYSYGGHLCDDDRDDMTFLQTTCWVDGEKRAELGWSSENDGSWTITLLGPND